MCSQSDDPTMVDTLPANLVALMQQTKARCAEPCPICGAGRGRWCRDRATDQPKPSQYRDVAGMPKTVR